jgi:hypothetical protein
LLTKLRDDLDDLDSLRRLQQLLVGEIMRAERSGRKVKADLNAVQASGGPSKAKRASSLKSRLEKIRQLAFVWRTFGDAIAFLYMDKFAIKQTFYSIHSTAPQQSAGFLSDKIGLVMEVAAVEEALKRGIPALLTDITNTIRHGDICLLIGPDPMLIEIKTSKKLDRRGRRQRDELRELEAFFRSDKTDRLRGMGPARRVAVDSEEITYIDEMEACIAEAI